MAEQIGTVTVPAEHTKEQWRTACEQAYTMLREQRETSYDDITPVEYDGADGYVTYLHTDSGRNAYVAIVVTR